MSPSLHELLATDATLDLLAQRRFDGSDDDVLASLAELADAVDVSPLPTAEPPIPPILGTAGRPVTQARRGGLALAATVGLVLSMSGMAAAVTGDVLAPLHYVAKKVFDFDPPSSGQRPGWDVDGMGPVSVIETKGITRAVAPLSAGSRLARSAAGPGQVPPWAVSTQSVGGWPLATLTDHRHGSHERLGEHFPSGRGKHREPADTTGGSVSGSASEPSHVHHGHLGNPNPTAHLPGASPGRQDLSSQPPPIHGPQGQPTTPTEQLSSQDTSEPATPTSPGTASILAALPGRRSAPASTAAPAPARPTKDPGAVVVRPGLPTYLQQ